MTFSLPLLTRRAALFGAAASTVALAAPVTVTLAKVDEHPNKKVRRLGREIMETLRDPEFIGFNRITITPQYVGYSAEPDADLIELAQQLKELVAAAYAAQEVAREEREKVFDEYHRLYGRGVGSDLDGFMDLFESSPARPADDAMGEAWRKVEEVGEIIRATPAVGLGGVWVKLIVVQNDHGYRDDQPRIDQDLGEERLNELLDEIGVAAGLAGKIGYADIPHQP